MGISIVKQLTPKARAQCTHRKMQNVYIYIQQMEKYEKDKTLPPSMRLPVIGEIAGVNMASLGGYLYSSNTRARWVEGFHNELNGHAFGLERDGLHQVVSCP